MPSDKVTSLGREPLFHTSLLYYPHGASLLTHGVGPIEGLFALPFWLSGPQAAYNGALLVGLSLTGYFMYLLVRGLGLDKGIALFAGILLVSSEMPLAGLLGHIEKTLISPISSNYSSPAALGACSVPWRTDFCVLAISAGRSKPRYR